ncbi:MAG: MoaD/ThiS family protein [Verrucomicrobiota bacterium]
MSSESNPADLRVLFFGHLPQITECPQTEWPFKEATTVADLMESLYQKWPGLRASDSSLRVAVNLEYTHRSALLPPGAEVAVMPPVQGG